MVARSYWQLSLLELFFSTPEAERVERGDGYTWSALIGRGWFMQICRSVIAMGLTRADGDLACGGQESPQQELAACISHASW